MTQTIEQRRAWEAKNRSRLSDYSRRRYYRAAYGLELEQIQQRVEYQGGKCPICLDRLKFPSKQAHVDHHHTGGHLRGVLCNRCNLLLGYAREDLDLLLRALDYLRTEGRQLQ